MTELVGGGRGRSDNVGRLLREEGGRKEGGGGGEVRRIIVIEWRRRRGEWEGSSVTELRGRGREEDVGGEECMRSLS